MEADSIGNRIKMVRENARYTQEDFADELGFSRGYINQLENGKKVPTERTVSRISRTFRVNLLWLESGAGRMHGGIDPCLIEKVEKLIDDRRFCATLINAVLTSLNDKELDLLDDILRKMLITEQHLY